MSQFRGQFIFVSLAFSVLALFALPSPGSAQTGCGPLPAPSGGIIDVTPAQASSLASIVNSAQPGSTIRLADGMYPLSQTLVFRNQQVTLRSKSGNRAAVTLDGNYTAGDLLLIYASQVTIADLTLTHAYYHPVHVVPSTQSSSGTLLHNLRLVDGASQFIKINPANGYYADNGVIRCSSLELTDAGRTQIRNNCYTGGIDAHQAWGWQVYNNTLSGFWCSSGLSEHAIHFWTGSRDTLVDRNIVLNSARGIGFGLEQARQGRTYPDQPCAGKPFIGHYGGTITNNFVSVNDNRVFDSAAGFDTGIGLEQACETNVLHNTIASIRAPRSSSIEWRFTNTLATVANNLVTHTVRPRDGGIATLAGNVTNAPLFLFVDAATTGDLHLVSTASAAIDKAAALMTPVAWDIDGTSRGAVADVGADEYVGAVVTVQATPTVVAGGSIEVTWMAPGGQVSLSDWIGLFAAGTPDSATLSQQSTSGQPSGTMYFTAPSTAGLFDFRYFKGSTSVRAAVSNSVTVTAASDTTPPTVSITSPVNGQQVTKNVDVQVNVTDNIGVVKVELYVDGALKTSSTTQPFTLKWNARNAHGAHTLQTKAYDAAGNVGVSLQITVYR